MCIPIRTYIYTQTRYIFRIFTQSTKLQNIKCLGKSQRQYFLFSFFQGRAAQAFLSLIAHHIDPRTSSPLSHKICFFPLVELIHSSLYHTVDFFWQICSFLDQWAEFCSNHLLGRKCWFIHHQSLPRYPGQHLLPKFLRS